MSAEQVRADACDLEMGPEEIEEFDRALKVLIETTEKFRRRIYPREPEQVA